MTTTPTCSWMGLMPDGEHLEPCGRPAHFYVEAAERHRIYSCSEHLEHAKAQAGNGSVVHMVPAYKGSSQPGEYTTSA